MYDDAYPWCVTQTDVDGTPIREENGHLRAWGYCHGLCPIDQGLDFFSSTIEHIHFYHLP